MYLYSISKVAFIAVYKFDSPEIVKWMQSGGKKGNEMKQMTWGAIKLSCFSFCINSALWGEGDVVEFYLDLTKKDWPMNSVVQ